MNNLRYTVNISFNDWVTKNIVEKVATLQEAKGYKSIIDDTVKEAIIIDNISGKVVHWLKKSEVKIMHRMPINPKK